MVIILDNWIVISNDDPSYNILSINLKFTEPSRKRKVKGREYVTPEVTNYIYYLDDGYMYIPVGLLDIIRKYFDNSEVIDKRVSSVYDDKSYTDDIINSIDKYKNILPGITLRREQLMAVRKIIFKKRCLVQLVTGSGKTEIMCALVKILQSVEGITPTVLILEPTSKLVIDTIKRFEKYGINVTNYSKNRSILNNYVNICHPKSLCNDIEKDKDILNNVDILIGDECHHLRSKTFRKPVYNMNNLSYSIGLSASVIDQTHINSKEIHEFSFDELLVIGATGPLVMNVKAELMLGDKLADPVLMVFNNKANEDIGKDNDNNWHKISKVRLESRARSELICNISKFFKDRNRKVLILVRTTAHARLILEILYNLGLSSCSRASYGGGYFEYYNGSEYEQDSNDVFDKYSKGIFKILIGTQHLIEGIDVPNLDVIVLGYAGRNEKVIVQSVGRVLRKTKTGRYGYIIDFNDTGDIVLSKHSRIRMDKYRNIIGIPENHIYENIDFEDLADIFTHLEMI